MLIPGGSASSAENPRVVVVVGGSGELQDCSSSSSCYKLGTWTADTVKKSVMILQKEFSDDLAEKSLVVRLKPLKEQGTPEHGERN